MFHKKELSKNMFLFLVCSLIFSLLVSIAGMELFGWSVTACSFFYYAIEVTRKRTIKWNELSRPLKLGPDLALWCLWIVAAIGPVVNGNKETDYIYIVGNFRWIILLYGYGLIWRYLDINNFSIIFKKILVPLIGLVSLYSIVQVFTGWDIIRWGREVHYLVFSGIKFFRASGFFNNPMTFAHSFIMWFCILLMFIFEKGYKREKIFPTIVLGILSLALLLSFIRGVWISGIFAILTMLWIWCRRSFYYGIYIIIVTFVILSISFSPIRARVLSIFSTQNGENRDRVTLWKANLEIFKEHPLIGIGYTENERRIEEYYKRLKIEDGFHGHAHNVYLQFLAGTGILGLGCYLFFIFYFLLITFRLWKEIPRQDTWHKMLVLGCLGAQISLHIGGFTQNNFSDGEVTHNFIFILALIVGLKRYYCVKKDYKLLKY